MIRYLLCGPCDRSGIGAMTRDIVEHGKPAGWFVTPGRHGTDDAYLRQCKVPYTLPLTQGLRVASWRMLMETGKFDAVIFVERLLSLPDEDCLRIARQAGVRIGCIPMWEAVPKQGWPALVDFMWMPSAYTNYRLSWMSYQDMPWQKHTYGDRWGVDVDHFKELPRTVCKRFLFAAGHGGQRERKGADTLRKLLNFNPKLPFLVTTQQADFPALIGHDVEIRREDLATREEGYRDGDVLVSLSHWEGLGLPLYEAQACGMPVMAPDKPPMNECRPAWLIPGTVVKQEALRAGLIPRWDANIQQLNAQLEAVLNTDITVQSHEARCNMERLHDIRSVMQDLEATIAMECEHHDAKNSS